MGQLSNGSESISNSDSMLRYTHNVRVQYDDQNGRNEVTDQEKY